MNPSTPLRVTVKYKMKKILLTLTIIHYTLTMAAQLPDTDIWLLDVSEVNGKFNFSNPVNITSRKGYDNQPAFSPDGKYILYTSIRDTTQSDIYRYDVDTKQTTQFTKTPTSEYSPTFMEGGKNISVVMVEKDSAQRLWKFPISGSKPSRIMEMDSIGYHCWFSKNRLGVFVLTKPFTLQWVGTGSEQPKVIADSIGRCIKMHNSMMYFTTKDAADKASLNLFNLPGFHTKKLFEMPGEDFVMRNGLVICSSGSKLFICKQDGNWVELCNLSLFGIEKAGRIALSPDGKKMAIVSMK